ATTRNNGRGEGGGRKPEDLACNTSTTVSQWPDVQGDVGPAPDLAQPHWAIYGGLTKGCQVSDVDVIEVLGEEQRRKAESVLLVTRECFRRLSARETRSKDSAPHQRVGLRVGSLGSWGRAPES
ncbi:hypothetical protein GOP47_0006799, partial [Adiantum capillus-veneris]